MTEQQIKNLQSLLAASKADENSAELDQKIQAAAAARAAQQQIDAGPRQTFGFGRIGTAMMSVVLTVVLFLGMSRVLEVEDGRTSLADLSGDQLPETRNNDTQLTASGQPGLVFIAPDAPLDYPGAAHLSRDEILVELELPGAGALLDSMDFPLSTDRSFAATAVYDAMADINSMIGSGELDGARKRYERLRQSCDVCQLPDTLEALALARMELPDRG